MDLPNKDQESAGIDFQEILFVLFRHKGKIIFCTLVGLVAAAAIYVIATKYYQSDAKLLVRYVLDRSAVDAVSAQKDPVAWGGDGLMAAEAVILNSWDLAGQVAQTIGPERILAGSDGPVSLGRATKTVSEGLEVLIKGGNNVVQISFRAKNPEIVQPVLEEFVRQYFEKHLQVHRSQQALDFVAQQRDSVRGRLVDIQDQLKRLKDQAGITALADSSAAANEQISRLQQSVMEAEATRSEQSARVAYYSKALGLSDGEPKDSEPAKFASVPAADAEQYKALVERLTSLRKAEFQLLGQYTPESSMVQSTHGQIRELERRKGEMETKFPALLTVANTRPVEGNRAVDAMSEQANLQATEAKLKVLTAQLEQARATASKINTVAPQIEDLERQKAIEEKTYADFQTKLEMQRINEALDPSRIPNISVVQKPTPPAVVVAKTKKTVLGVAAGGLAAGLGLAILFGMVLDRTVKRPAELEKRLGIPTMLQIPKLSRRQLRQLDAKKGEASANGKQLATAKPPLVPWGSEHFIRPFARIICDRLILAFELKRVTHKPKLVGITGLAGGEGASTVAGGLAAALSETDHGKVLLVDMTSDNPEMRPFSEGHTSTALLDALLSNGEGVPATENLYLATGEAPGTNSRMIAPRRFYEMIPILRESQFDYIIFDMPPLEQGSATLAISGYMDKLLLLVEPERSDRGSLKKAYQELVAAKADVVAIVNKTGNNVPRWALE